MKNEQDVAASDLGRREMLAFIGSIVAVGLAGCDGDGVGSPTSPSGSPSTPSTNAQCVVTPALTEGPYYVDEGLNRSDLRTDPSTGVAKPGVMLDLTMRLSQINAGGACSSLAGALVDVWHCDALGLYSDVAQQNTLGERFLRGYQISDGEGSVHFTTIYPGWYQGRAVHIHLKVRLDPGAPSGLEFTSQLFFDEALTDQVHAQAPYSQKGRRDTTNDTDGIYRGGGTQVLVPLTASGGGFAGTFEVGVRV